MPSEPATGERAASDPTDTTADDLVAALEALSRAQREAAARVAQLLDQPRAGVGLVRMLHKCGPAPLSELATRLKVDLSVASRQVSALVDAGYVSRTVDADDRRVRTLELTDAGRAFAEDVRKQFTAYVSRAFESWTPEDFSDAISALRRVAHTISADNEVTPRPATHQKDVP